MGPEMKLKSIGFRILSQAYKFSQISGTDTTVYRGTYWLGCNNRNSNSNNYQWKIWIHFQKGCWHIRTQTFGIKSNRFLLSISARANTSQTSNTNCMWEKQHNRRTDLFIFLKKKISCYSPFFTCGCFTTEESWLIGKIMFLAQNNWVMRRVNLKSCFKPENNLKFKALLRKNEADQSLQQSFWPQPSWRVDFFSHVPKWWSKELNPGYRKTPCG